MTHARKPTPRATYREAFRVAEFRSLWVATILSLVGDQLARVALSVLVYRRTNSPLLTATVYAMSFLPWVVGGPLLAGLADRYPRRTVMVVCDVVRMALVFLMVLPLPFFALAALLFGAELLASPFSAARSATLPEVLPGDAYVQGSAITNITIQTGQVIGFAAGGVLVAALSPQGALVADALTFAVSALVLRLGVRRRAPADAAKPGRQSLVASALAGARLVFGSPALRGLTILAWLCAFVVVPEGLAVPYAQLLHGGPTTAGILLAAHPLGAVLGAVVVSRFVLPDRRLRLMGGLAVLSCVPLLGFAGRPGLSWSVGLLMLSGLGSSYNLPANAAFVAAVPAGRRGQAFGMVQSGILVFQGLALLAAGAAAEWVDPHTVIAGAGALGALMATWLAATSLRPGGPVLAEMGRPVAAR